ncbi:MAG: hypothetical protein P8X67_10430 [Syntrophobacterales bacterium]
MRQNECNIDAHRFHGYLARIFHEWPSRDREDGVATWQPQGLEPHGRSRQFIKYPG